ncbi:MAG: hypothetical protein Q8N79_04125 [Candidatus Methanoperedens sp.]|nr:hypothetical protein [Candidatus Methanoperedens sp.]
MKEMIEKEILRKALLCNTFSEEFKEMEKEDRELYLFMRGGFAAK